MNLLNLPRARKLCKQSRPRFSFHQRLCGEPLEDRKMLTLLGIVPDFPVTTYDSNGTLVYDASTDSLDINATPLRFKESAAAPQRLVQNPKDFEIHIQVDGAGNLIGGAPGDDFHLEGSIDINGDSIIDVTGVLLTGDISQFGHEDVGATDLYDFRFTPTGGSLMSYFIGKDIGVTLTSEGSTFTGDFNSNFQGGAKGNIGTLEPLLSSIAGNVYQDNNNNGVFETGLGEPGIQNVTVTLTGTDVDGQLVNTFTTTDVNGAYSFPNLRPGDYTITETQPGGYLDGMDTQGTPGNGITLNDVFANISLAAGINGVDNNFGELSIPAPLPSSLAGFVYEDTDNDGIFDMGEAPIAGVLITLTGTDITGPVNLFTFTDVTGAYSFPSLNAGTYTITETQPGGYLDGKDTQGTPGTGTAGNDNFSNIVLLAGVDGTDNNFGELVAASLAGFVYVDTDNDGVFDMGEAPIGGATVTLTGTDDLGNPVNVPGTTNGAGAYSFPNLRPGTYTITETQPAGFLDGKDTQGTPGNGTAGNDVFVGIMLASGVNGVNNNFGERPLGSISGTKYEDLTGNGQSADDVGLAGTTIYLDANNNGVLNAGETSTVTGAGGQYTFTGLLPGTYTVREVVPTGYIRTGPTLSDNYVVTIGVGQAATGKDFANFEKCDMSALSNIYYVINGTTVVTDLRGNVHQGDVVEVFFTVNVGEHPHQYTLVSYTAPSPTFIASEASQQEIFDEATGIFGPGEHSLTVTVPHCYFQIDFVCGAAIDQLGPAGSNIFYTPQMRLFSADNGGTQACAYGGSLSGFVWADTNCDGDVDANELAISGVKITLTGYDKYGAAVTMVAYTDDDGMYLFDNLKAGTYKITETDPVGYNDGTDVLGSLGGTRYNDMFANIALATGRSGVNYNFAEVRVAETLRQGQTATIAFWNNSRGQTLIKAMNGSSTSTKLGNWLATNFRDMYGSTAGTMNMTGKTNAQVAARFQSLFSNASQKLEAQVLATALAVYATNSTLAGGTYARTYGFTVNTTGTGSATVDIGENGVALGLSDHAVITVMQLLQRTNERAFQGRLWDLNDSGTTSTAESFLRGLGLDLFTLINLDGGIN